MSCIYISPKFSLIVWGQVGGESKPRSGSSWGVSEERSPARNCDSKEPHAPSEGEAEADQASCRIATRGTVFMVLNLNLSNLLKSLTGEDTFHGGKEICPQDCNIETLHEF